MNDKIKVLGVGSLILVASVIVIITIFMLGQKNQIFTTTVPIKVKFGDIGGLQEGASVRISGIDVGIVDKIQLPSSTEDKVMVELRVSKEAQKLIKQDSRATITTEGLVGSKIIQILPGSKESPVVKENGFIQGKRPTDFSAILESFENTSHYMEELASSVSAITSRIQSGQGTIGRLVYDDELYQSLQKLTSSGDSTFSYIVNEGQELHNIIAHLAGLVESIITDVKSGQGTLGKLVYSDSLHNTAIRTVTSLRDSFSLLLSDIRNSNGTLGKLIYSDQLHRNLTSSVDTLTLNVDHLIDRLEKVSDMADISLMMFSENMKALHQNWFFKDYYQQKTPFNKSEFQQELQKRRDQLHAVEQEIQQRRQELQTLKQQIQELRKSVHSGEEQ